MRIKYKSKYATYFGHPEGKTSEPFGLAERSPHQTTTKE